MDALRRSVRSEEQQTGRKQSAKRGRKRIEGQKEMLFPIAGKKAAKEVARKSTRAAGRRKAG
jgi:DNA end-binding protein Ku